ncbi:hypothetical protein C8R47DRAFT_1228246 [Mycena vitilis]|nr:hypothetical protein C8R47DRAFT_1228246 [Mycena vitilis]
MFYILVIALYSSSPSSNASSSSGASSSPNSSSTSTPGPSPAAVLPPSSHSFARARIPAHFTVKKAHVLRSRSAFSAAYACRPSVVSALAPSSSSSARASHFLAAVSPAPPGISTALRRCAAAPRVQHRASLHHGRVPRAPGHFKRLPSGRVQRAPGHFHCAALQHRASLHHGRVPRAPGISNAYREGASSAPPGISTALRCTAHPCTRPH